MEESGQVGHSLVIGLLMAVAGVLAIELGLSVAVLEIAAGFLARNVIGIWHAEWLEFIAQFGLITLMFIAGFEVDIPMLRKDFGKSTLVGGLSFLVPFAGIYAISLLFPSVDYPKAVIFAICMSTTSLALVFPVLREQGLLLNAPGQFLLSSAMVVDIASVIALLVFFVEPGPMLLLGGISVVIIFALAPLLGRWLFGRWRGNIVEMEVRFILLALLALLFIASETQVHAALTGFVFGVVMSTILRKHYQVEEKVRSIVFSFFAPVFFFHAGSQMDISQFRWNDALLVMVLTPAAFLFKFGGSYYPFTWFRCSLNKFAAILFNYRLSFAIVAALFGLQTGRISPGEYSAIMCVVLLTSLGTALLLRFRPNIESPPME
jgi:glutathione-regulated potassium-efflux system ancillary protein KefC